MSTPLLHKTITDTEDILVMVLLVRTRASNQRQNLVQDTTMETEVRDPGQETEMIARSTLSIADKTLVTLMTTEKIGTDTG